MIIEKLILAKNKRLHLLENDIFTLDFENQHTVIRGVSGIGKSTIMYELSPLPAHMKGYSEGGYKEIHIRHQNKCYQLISSGKGAGTHQFIVDGVDLNDGGTRTVQLKLVEEHFNYTPKLHDIMMGHERFTRMSGNDRRYWFSQLSNTDSEFVNKLWDSIRSGHRDIKGALVENQAKLIEHSGQLATDDEIQSVRRSLKNYEDLRDELNRKLGEYDRGSIDDAVLTETVSRVLGIISILDAEYTQFIDKVIRLNNHSAPVQSGCIERRDLLVAESSMASAQLQDTQKSIEQTTARLRELDASDGSLYENLDDLIKKHQARYEAFSQQRDITFIKQVIENIVQNHGQSRVSQVLNRISTIPFGYLSDIRDALIGCQDYEQSLDTYHQEWLSITEKRKAALNRLQLSSENLEEMKKHYEQMLREPNHTCPSCQYSFRDNASNENALLNRIKEQDAYIQKLKEIINKHDERLRELDTPIQLYRLFFKSFITDGNTLSSFLYLFGVMQVTTQEEKWQYLAKHQSDINDILVRLPELADQCQEYLKLHEEEQTLNELKRKGDIRSSPEYIQLLTSLKKDEQMQERLNTRLTEIDDELKILNRVITDYDTVHEQYRRINDTIGNLIELTRTAEQGYFSSAIKSSIAIINEEINVLNKRVKYYDGTQYLIEHLTKSKTELEYKRAEHETLMQLLNPKDGLIAKSMIGFIRAFVQEVNHLILHVWTYHFEISIEESDDFTKNYTFPVSVGNDKQITSDDVSMTSTGQSEMIDLAFKLIVAKYMGLDNWCIYADELGGTLNTAHRNNLYSLLKRLVDEGIHSQLFVITHLDDIESMMSQAKVIELK